MPLPVNKCLHCIYYRSLATIITYIKHFPPASGIIVLSMETITPPPPPPKKGSCFTAQEQPTPFRHPSLQSIASACTSFQINMPLYISFKTCLSIHEMSSSSAILCAMAAIFLNKLPPFLIKFFFFM